ncbi:hypothetical protein T12_1963, partial [Trichinella patagoniensis]
LFEMVTLSELNRVLSQVVFITSSLAIIVISVYERKQYARPIAPENVEKYMSFKGLEESK